MNDKKENFFSKTFSSAKDAAANFGIFGFIITIGGTASEFASNFFEVFIIAAIAGGGGGAIIGLICYYIINLVR
tara:strand:+ start:953 stop:1174 length:222 start_codon:yes stop_codon:yes gene_type:complete